MTARALLMTLTAGFGAMGLTFVLAPSLTLSFFDWMVYGGTSASPVPPDMMEGETRRYAGFIYQVLGAVIFGWAVALWLIVRGPDANNPDNWAVRSFALSFGAWFVVDTAMSLAMGFWQNAVFNTLFGVGAAATWLAWRRKQSRAANSI